MTNPEENTNPTPSPEARTDAPGGDRGKRGRGGRSDNRGPKAPDSAENFLAKDAQEWHEKVLQIRRVTKVVKGGKKLSFRAVVVVGNGNGQVGFGTGKSGEVVEAIRKAVVEARKALVEVPLHKTTIPHIMKASYGSSDILLKPASEGTGVIAGGALRAVLELAGVKDVLSKTYGSRSPLNVAQAAIKALSTIRSFSTIAEARGLSVKEMLS